MKIFKYILFAILPLCWCACEYATLKTFDSEPDAYFTNLRDAIAYNDSIVFNFFFFSGNVQDTTLTVSVTITGKLSDADRYVAVKAHEQSTAVEGVHYTMPNAVKIPAGKISGTMGITIHRAADLRTPNVPPKVLRLSLVGNDDFGVNIKKEVNSNNKNDTIGILDYKIIFADLMKQPKYWSLPDFGSYSDKKFLLICQCNNIAPAYIDGQKINDKIMTPGEGFIYALITQSYLNEQTAADNVIYEADGVTPMRMGDAVNN